MAGKPYPADLVAACLDQVDYGPPTWRTMQSQTLAAKVLAVLAELGPERAAQLAIRSRSSTDEKGQG